MKVTIKTVALCTLLALLMLVFCSCGNSNASDTRNKCLGCGKTILWSENYCYECQYKMGLTN